VRAKAPKITRKHKATLDLLKVFYAKPVDYRHVTAEEMYRFCTKWLPSKGVTPLSCDKHMDNLRGMFSAVQGTFCP
jgi:hypothetical protein